MGNTGVLGSVAQAECVPEAKSPVLPKGIKAKEIKGVLVSLRLKVRTRGLGGGEREAGDRTRFALGPPRGWGPNDPGRVVGEVGNKAELTASPLRGPGARGPLPPRPLTIHAPPPSGRWWTFCDIRGGPGPAQTEPEAAP